MTILALFVSILVELNADGSANFTERWDVDATRGTEWYLVKRNLGDISISDFSVSEDGRAFTTEKGWDVDRSIKEKKDRCGILFKDNGCELCWGLGSYDHHCFTVRYTMTNVVKSLDDCDIFHMQLVSPGLSDAPDHVDVEIVAPVALSSANSAIWGFGYNGTAVFDEGTVRLESSEPFGRNSSVISLIRFDKGIFHSSSVQDKKFQTVLDTALEGASFSDDYDGDDDDGALEAFLSFIGSVIAISGLALAANRRSRRKVLGCAEKDIEWSRDIPFGGDVIQSDYVLSRIGRSGRDDVASAMILRMLQRGQLAATKDAKGNLELSFTDNADLTALKGSERMLYDMMKAASGSDVILQKNEFSRWARRHGSTIVRWTEQVRKDALQSGEAGGFMSGSRFTPEGQKQARGVVGFRKFLKDFTLIELRGAAEVKLWQDYLVFGALYGIADKVAQELKEINPELFGQTITYDYETTRELIWLTRSMAGSITNARAAQASGSSRGGFGGASSFGGGGGFSGGGFGGGAR